MSRSQAEAYERQHFASPRVDMGAKQHLNRSSEKHWLHLASLLAPLVIGELVEDAEKRWRYIRIASIGTAAVGEVLWQHKIRAERDEARIHR